MYSPTLGRFLSVDPLEFDAGDPNLYRTEGNNPVTYVDPSGLEKRKIGGTYAAQLDLSDDFTPEEKDAIQKAFQMAGDRIRQSYLAMTLYWKEIGEDSTYIPDGATEPKTVRFWTELNREWDESFQINSGGVGHVHHIAYNKFRGRLKLILDKLTDQNNVIPICPDRKPSETGGWAYVNFWEVGQIAVPGTTIFIRDKFFDPETDDDRRRWVITHELGRLYLWLHADKETSNQRDFWGDVNEWDATLDWLVQEFHKFKGKTPKK